MVCLVEICLRLKEELFRYFTVSPCKRGKNANETKDAEQDKYDFCTVNEKMMVRTGNFCISNKHI